MSDNEEEGGFGSGGEEEDDDAGGFGGEASEDEDGDFGGETSEASEDDEPAPKPVGVVCTPQASERACSATPSAHPPGAGFRRHGTARAGGARTHACDVGGLLEPGVVAYQSRRRL